MENVLQGERHQELDGKEYDLYKDIQSRTNNELFLGVVGPVRTGKSTFIKRFMDICVLPNMTDAAEKVRAQDELPQSSGGKTITTTEPKFIPKEAAEIQLAEGIKILVRLIDCVGYMVDGAVGHMENGSERMVKTPWSVDEIPFTQAAEIGTRKVIRDHATIGIVITTDGSFGDLDRSNYQSAEEETILELKELGKPFIVLVNTIKPYGEEANRIAREIEETYQVRAMPVNVEQLKKQDILHILEQVLYEFPLTVISFYLPKWVETLQDEHPMKRDLIEKVMEMREQIDTIRDVMEKKVTLQSSYLKRCALDHVDLSDGSVSFFLEADEGCYYDMLSELTGEEITGDYQLIQMLRKLSEMKQEYEQVRHALEAVRQKGYGVVTPKREEIQLDKPEIIKHGNKYGVKIKAQSPSLHMIKANIETEIAPIVGSEEQARDLIRYIVDADECKDGIWDTNIFGKTVEQLVKDGINSKISMIGEESQVKLQETMQKIVNDSNGGMVCIII